jgi:hypothetical protein
MSKEQCSCEKNHLANSHYVKCQEAGECICGPCECDCHYGPEEPVEPVETIEESRGCRHTELIVASRNAIVAFRSRVTKTILENPFGTRALHNEIARAENAYDALLMGIEENGCESCKYDALNPDRESNYLMSINDNYVMFIDDYVTHFANGKCDSCK